MPAAPRQEPNKSLQQMLTPLRSVVNLPYFTCTSGTLRTKWVHALSSSCCMAQWTADQCYERYVQQIEWSEHALRMADEDYHSFGQK
jgi:hypothetical protein